MDKKILITGGNGFIARSLYEDLSNSYFAPLQQNVFAPNRSKLDLLNPLEVFQCLRDNQFDVVIHSATYDPVPRFSSKDPDQALEKNLRMFFNIAKHKDYFGKMIFFGSGAEAGRENWVHRMNEQYIESKVPPDQYGYSKHIMSNYAANTDNIYNLRLFGVFGKFDDWRYRFISNACCKAVLDMPITIKKNVYFDYLYMKDLSRIVKWFIESSPKENIYNVCSGETYDYRALAKTILSVSSKDLRISVQDSELGREYSGDNSLLMSEIAGFKYTPIHESIKELYEWYNTNRSIIDSEAFEY
tara:strand:+ start:1833 stop:2735 length:903 start_codon:yes stop_codon:yes gene_type:complete